MPVEIGTHRNGMRFARARITEKGIDATIEATGPNDDIATAQLAYQLRKLGEICEDIATEMQTADHPGDRP